jgi:hypothetical protein
MSNANVLGRLLRAPSEIAEACREDRDSRTIVTTSLAAILVGAAVFGGVIGGFRGGIQIAYAAVKVPLAVFLTLAICAPAFHALAAGLGRPWPLRSIIALALAAAGRSALVLLALSPALWLLYDVGVGYHSAALAASVAYAVAGLAALSVILRGLDGERGRWLTAFAFVSVFFAVGGQTSWILRPYLVRPRTVSVPFLRAREGGFADALVTSSRSARGIYVTREIEEAAASARARRETEKGSTDDEASKADEARTPRSVDPSSAEGM